MQELQTFDAHGNYYLKKDPASIQDKWLEGMDWNKVGVGSLPYNNACYVLYLYLFMLMSFNNKTHTHAQLEEQREWSSTQKPDSADSEGEEDEPAIDKLTIYRQIMEILHPGETLPKVYINHRVEGEEGKGGG